MFPDRPTDRSRSVCRTGPAVREHTAPRSAVPTGIRRTRRVLRKAACGPEAGRTPGCRIFPKSRSDTGSYGFRKPGKAIFCPFLGFPSRSPRPRRSLLRRHICPIGWPLLDFRRRPTSCARRFPTVRRFERATGRHRDRTARRPATAVSWLP